MSHSLHRLGSSESLKRDYVFLCTPAQGINSTGATQKLIEILDILLEVGPVNLGFYNQGAMMSGICIEAIKENINDNSRLRCCFDSREKIKEVLKRVNAKNFGLSIVISGLITEIIDIAKELSLKPHTINISCGVFGRVDRLPEAKALEISTMCGHGMIAHRFTTSTIEKFKKDQISLDEAIQLMGEPCTCGIYNPTRAREILQSTITTIADNSE
jgi:hypothetical protein